MIRNHDIYVAGNYLFGLPEDNYETMQQTLDLAIELNTTHANFYPVMALPGSSLYNISVQNGWQLPDSYAGYGFLSERFPAHADKAPYCGPSG